MKACPECGGLATFNTYFGAYICPDCHWRDDTFNVERAKYMTCYEIKREAKNAEAG